MTTQFNKQQQQLIDALKSPYQTAFLPNFILKALGKNTDVYDIAKIILFMGQQEQLKYLMDKCQSDSEALPQLRAFLIQIGQDKKIRKAYADYFGLNYEADKEQVNELFEQQVMRKLKISFNHIAQKDGASDKTKVRDYKAKTNTASTVLTVFVALGQAAIAASCFIILGVATPWFWPIFIAAFITNYMLMKTDIADLFKKALKSIFMNKDFLNDMTGKKRTAAKLSLILAVAAGLTFGFMSLFSAQAAFVSLLTLMGVGMVAAGPIAWIIAIAIAIATFPVITALMFNSMASLVESFEDKMSAIKAYFSYKTYQAENSEQSNPLLRFIASRAAQVLLAFGVIAFTVVAIISTFGSYTSAIGQAMQTVFKASAALSTIASFAIVMVCTAIPELIFNMQNVYKFVTSIPGEFKLAWKQAKLIASKEEISPVVRISLMITLTLTLVFVGLVVLNGVGNGKTGSTPDGAGVKALQGIFGISSSMAVTLGMITSSGMSMSGNGNYGLEGIKDASTAAAKAPANVEASEVGLFSSTDDTRIGKTDIQLNTSEKAASLS